LASLLLCGVFSLVFVGGQALWLIAQPTHGAAAGLSLSAQRAEGLLAQKVFPVPSFLQMPHNVEACRIAPVRWACVEGRIVASVCCTPPFNSLNR